MTTPFDNMSPEKAQFIKQMSFSDEETDALVSQLTKNLSPKEKKRVELLHQLSKMLAKQSKKTPPPQSNT